MKTAIICLLVLSITIASAVDLKSVLLNKRATASCPSSHGMVGICLWDPNVNCMSNLDCTGGMLCCPHGCGSICMKPVH
ncbi:waprin-Phi3-like [Mizuhopecten yessoensis]|uniref:WAP domain-containing protein n=1 Tax=Mizuhopecten yessoensis TaxID=6573 RepID=A0A210QN39_MIZYE|nr:waprin-Phi3-like [Mizuhopecten yessoensis]OWF50152.1 hypothetical protein KP79_PYT14110 [Mizuhopecten yessoensis]